MRNLVTSLFVFFAVFGFASADDIADGAMGNSDRNDQPHGTINWAENPQCATIEHRILNADYSEFVIVFNVIRRTYSVAEIPARRQPSSAQPKPEEVRYSSMRAATSAEIAIVGRCRDQHAAREGVFIATIANHFGIAGSDATEIYANGTDRICACGH